MSRGGSSSHPKNALTRSIPESRVGSGEPGITGVEMVWVWGTRGN